MIIVAVIPARYAATRFPGKLMQMLGNKSIIRHVYDNTLSTGLFNDVFVVTDSDIIYKAIKDITWFNNFMFPKVSETLGPVKMNVTVINTDNKAHNVVPSQCSFTVDIRVTDAYTHEQVLEIIKLYVKSEVKPRSMRMRATSIDPGHPIVKAGVSLDKSIYGSPTCSDKALMPFPALKIGPGDSARSHTADEYIYVDEIKEGIDLHIQILSKILL